MWDQSLNNDEMDGAASKDKQIEDTQIDSGFISGSNLLSSQLSIDYENEERSRDDVVAPEPVKPSNFDEDFSKLSLKDLAVELDSGIIDPISEDLSSKELKSSKDDIEEIKLPENLSIAQWQLYYSQDNDGDTQLHLAVIQEFTEATNYLINIAPYSYLYDIQNDDWYTVLHLAVLTKQAKIVRKLILSGANPIIRDFQGNTPLHIACDIGSLDCVKALISPLSQSERSAIGDNDVKISSQDLQMRNYNGQMCLHLATKKAHIEIIRYLVSIGADVNATEALSGYSALHLAIGLGLNEVALVLVLEGRAKINSKTYGGRTAYGLARRLNPKLAADLYRFGTKPSQPLDFSSDESDDNDDDDDDDMEDDNDDVEEQNKLREIIGKFNMSSPLVM